MGNNKDNYISFRVQKELKQKAEVIAAQKKRNMSDIARFALEDYVQAHSNAELT